MRAPRRAASSGVPAPRLRETAETPEPRVSNIASSTAAGPPPGMKVRLSSNESPHGPSPAAVAAATRAVAEAHLYPDDQSIALRQALADEAGLPLEQVVVGNGSAALLMDALTCLARPAEDGAPAEVLAFERSFVVHRLGARNAGARYVEAPDGGPAVGDRDGYTRTPEALLERVTDATRVVVIDNPGNPTNAHLSGPELTALLAELPERVTVLLDEAYHDYATGQRGYATSADLGVDHPRVLVTRTFSKAHALAGLRIGVLSGPADLVAEVDAWRPRFNVAAPAQAAALASLGDRDHLARGIERTLEGRRRMVDHLRAMGIPLTAGLGNFVTVELGEDAQPTVDAYAARGIGVRPLQPYGMLEQIRVSVGSPDEVDAFLAASDEVLAGVASRAAG
ncbi:aminotransferase class I/II-fold pyridoxal phosphate-dependent enzyme [Nitriliruptoraceae bacterium ZYF776]|nr:aminotransferase class I/II-fold pyridoxal phosphate-dependent enzyme [Profundirhabdus halotolerans]